MRIIGRKTQIVIGVLVLGALVAWWMLCWYRQCADQTEFDMRLPEEFARLEPLFTKPAAPRPGEWLAKYPERGQTYEDYLRCFFRRPEPPKNVIYVLPLGEFTPKQEKILCRTAEFLHIYFDLPVRSLDARPPPPIPDFARRPRDSKYGEQWCSQYLLYKVLKSCKPDDAYLLLGFVAQDIWPGGKWNMVFGQASESAQVAVCSLARLCPAEKIAENRPLCLLRTLKVAAHECGHLFSMQHCTWYLCNMAGSNSLAETDRHPLALCPQCFAKICHVTGAEPIEQLKKLRNFCKKNGLAEDEKLYGRMLSRMQGN